MRNKEAFLLLAMTFPQHKKKIPSTKKNRTRGLEITREVGKKNLINKHVLFHLSVCLNSHDIGIIHRFFFVFFFFALCMRHLM